MTEMLLGQDGGPCGPHEGPGSSSPPGGGQGGKGGQQPQQNTPTQCPPTPSPSASAILPRGARRGNATPVPAFAPTITAEQLRDLNTIKHLCSDTTNARLAALVAQKNVDAAATVQLENGMLPEAIDQHDDDDDDPLASASHEPKQSRLRPESDYARDNWQRLRGNPRPSRCEMVTGNRDEAADAEAAEQACAQDPIFGGAAPAARSSSAAASSTTKRRREPTVALFDELGVERLQLDPPAERLQHLADTTQAREKRRALAQQLLGSLQHENGVRMCVTAERVVNGKKQPISNYTAMFVNNGGDLCIVFDDDKEQTPFSLVTLDERGRAYIIDYYVLVDGVYGLPPVDAALDWINIGGRTIEAPQQEHDVAIYAGVWFAPSGTESAAAIVVRAPWITKGQRVLWMSSLDVGSERKRWPGEEHTHGRVYGGGSRTNIGIIALIAALREAKHQLDALGQLGNDDTEGKRVAIIAEGEKTKEAFYELQQLIHHGTRLRPRLLNYKDRVKERKDINQMSTQHAELLNLARDNYLELGKRCYVGHSRFSFVAGEAAARKVLSQPTVGSGCTPHELNLFVNYVASRLENRKRNAEHIVENLACGLPAATSVNAQAAKIRTMQQFAEVNRKYRARTHVPRAAQAGFAAACYAQLLSVLGAEPGSERRDDAAVGLMLLPVLLLPTRGDAATLAARAAEMRPFNIDTESDRDARKLRNELDAAERPEWPQQRHPAPSALDDDAAEGGENAGAHTHTHTNTRTHCPNSEEEAEKRMKAMCADAAFLQLLGAEGDELRAMASKTGTHLSDDERIQVSRARQTLKAKYDKYHQSQHRIMEAFCTGHAKPEYQRQLERLAEAVERHANDFKISTARKLIECVVENEGKPDMPFEKKIELISNKFVKCRDRDVVPTIHNETDTVDFDEDTVRKVVKGMPRAAATCIECWNAKILSQCIAVRPEIAALIGRFCAEIVNAKFGNRVMDFLRLGRLVGIPKDDNSLRPISMLNFFAKLTGNLIMKRQYSDGRRPIISHQYAVGMPDGANRIVHRVRAEREAGAAIVRVDVSNGFGTAGRAAIKKKLESMSDALMSNRDEPDPYANIKKLFRIMYGVSHKLVMYGPNNKMNFVEAEEGIRQGDPFSVFYFCLLMECVTEDLAEKLPQITIRVFMDDITVTCPPQNARFVMHQLMQSLDKYGFKCNAHKSRIICNDTNLIGSYPFGSETENQREEARQAFAAFREQNHAKDGLFRYQRRLERGETIENLDRDRRQAFRLEENRIAETILQHRAAKLQSEFFAIDPETSYDQDAHDATKEVILHNKDDHFVVLGANISDNFAEYNEIQKKRQCGFFDMLEKVPLHEQLAFTLARISGFYKSRYYLSVTPPQHSLEVANAFQERCITYLEKLLQFKVKNQPFCHSSLGLGIPDYVSNAATLYQDSRNSTTLGIDALREPLVNTIPPQCDGQRTAHLVAQKNAPWMLYQPRGHDTRLTSPEFRLAVAIRCGTLPNEMMLNNVVRCGCPSPPDISTALGLITHAMNCRYSAYTPANRHTAIKCAIAKVLRRNNFSVTMEPTCYIGLYEDNVAHRPDITVFAEVPIVTDVTVVQQRDDRPGAAAVDARIKKNTLHKAAADKIGHVFFPFVLETHGHVDNSVIAFAQACTAHRSRFESNAIVQEITLAVAVELARARNRALISFFATSTSSPYRAVNNALREINEGVEENTEEDEDANEGLAC